MGRILGFPSATLAKLEKTPERKYYVYCLATNNNVFYVGKGCGNRVFAHEYYAQKAFEKLDQNDIKELEKLYSKQPKIKTIIENSKNIQRVILNHFLTEDEAFVGESTLINFLKIVQNIDLTNLVSGQGEKGMSVEELEKIYGYEPISKDNLKHHGLILAVKIKNSFSLSNDESLNYEEKRDDTNLKSRTLGVWKIGQDKINDIKYVIGINTGADNAVVSAYEIKEGNYTEFSYVKENKKTNSLFLHF